MSRNKIDKKMPALESQFEDILVCNNKSLRPHIEIFVFEPENVTQKSLGTLFGVLEVSDTSEDSSYIVNYLSSIIKREYFSKPKRSPIESFEAALHKGNLALSKLAEHGNIKWLGKFNALIAIIEKNNLHIAQAGTASAFLFRSKGLTDISEGMSSDELEPHPLKTFVNVSSGKLESQDKLIITTESIFDIFSFEEIKKSILRFSEEKFVQFLKTALGNELEKAAVLVVDLQEKEDLPPAPSPQKSEHFNAFSQSSYAKKSSYRAPDETEAGDIMQEEISPEMNTEIADEIKKGQAEFVDEKNGHIYIKETMEESLSNKTPNEFLMILEEKLSWLGKELKKVFKKLFIIIGSSLKNISPPRVDDASPRVEAGLPKINLEHTKKAEPKSEEKTAVKKSEIIENIKKYSDILGQKIKALFSAENRRKLVHMLGIASDKLVKFVLIFIPNSSKIKTIISKLNYQQKLYTVLIVLAIIVVPYFGLKLNTYIQSKKVKPVEPVVEIIVPLAQDKNVNRPESLNTVYASNNIISILNLKGKLFSVSQSNVTDLESKTEFPVPSDFGQIKITSSMDDLNLIFLINDKKQIISFSPISKKFQPSTIIIPENSTIATGGTYMTYLYLIDSANNQIYRYPRAEGGFGEKIDWLKDTLDLSQSTGIALSENIFITDNKTIIKLFKGKKQDFNLENSATPIAPSNVYTKIDSQNIYILDKQNYRIIKTDLNGSIIQQYYNAEIANANNFTIDEINNTAYISTSSDIKSFSIN